MPNPRTVPDADEMESRQFRRDMQRTAWLHRFEPDFRPGIDCNEPDFEHEPIGEDEYEA